MNHANPPLARARLLLAQDRYDLAEPLFRQALGIDPQHPDALAGLAQVLSHKKEHAQAIDLARQAVAQAPIDAATHATLASVLDRAGELKPALLSIEQALSIEPESADYHALHSQILLNLHRTREGLASAEQGLAMDADHQGCLNLRAIALTRLGRRDEAQRTIGAALERAPESPIAHANRGWTLLHQGRPKDACDAFKESLRLDPANPWARQGLVEALKARAWPYRWFLGYTLWMSRLSPRTQWIIILGGFFGVRALNTLGKSNPDLEPFITPLIVAYVAFALTSCIAVPLTDLFLLLHPLGRNALPRSRRIGALVLGMYLLVPITALALWSAIGGVIWQLTAMLTGFLVVPVALAGMSKPPRPTLILGGLCVVLAGLEGWIMWRLLDANPPPPGFATAYVVGCVLVAPLLANAMPRA